VIELAQGTGSDRKDAKAVIHDTLDPRHPWRGTLSSSDRVPSALSFFIAARFILLQGWQQSKGRLLSVFCMFKHSLLSLFSLRFLQKLNATGVLPVAAHRANCHRTADLGGLVALSRCQFVPLSRLYSSVTPGKATFIDRMPSTIFAPGIGRR